MFDDPVWDFPDVTGLPVQMPPATRRFDFTGIINPRWRQVARELIMALLAPRHEAVPPLPRAYRTPLHLGTAPGRLAQLPPRLNFPTQPRLTGPRAVGDRRRPRPAGWQPSWPATGAAATRSRNWTTPRSRTGSSPAGIPQTRYWPSTSTRPPGRPASSSSRRDGFPRCATTSTPRSRQSARPGRGPGPPPG